jgi:hypothetical protein
MNYPLSDFVYNGNMHGIRTAIKRGFDMNSDAAKRALLDACFKPSRTMVSLFLEAGVVPYDDSILSLIQVKGFRQCSRILTMLLVSGCRPPPQIHIRDPDVIGLWRKESHPRQKARKAAIECDTLVEESALVQRIGDFIILAQRRDQREQ